jgi:Zn-finger nucleic acid-binding protein
MADRQGVEIDYCPQCRGIWLDRGELDKLIERSLQTEGQFMSVPPRREGAFTDYDDGDEYKRKNDEHYRGDRQPYSQDRRKKSFLGEIFDIFD